MATKRTHTWLFQVAALIFMLLFFIWENRKVSKEDQIFFWIIFIAAIISVVILFVYFPLREKLDKVSVHEQEIRKLKEQLSFRNKLDNIYLELGKLHKRGRQK